MEKKDESKKDNIVYFIYTHEKAKNFKISISIDVWEYPVGAIETYSIDTNGIELIESPDFICEDFY